MSIFKFSNLIIALVFVTYSWAQQFTKITQGDFVNDGGESFGVAWADLNNDNYMDLFVSNGGAAGVNANNFLYMNNGDGSFRKITNGDLVNGNQRSNGATIADFNNDGLADIAVANRDNQKNFLYTNNGNLEFTKINEGNIVNDGGNSNANSWVDYNNDGRLDLLVTNFFEPLFLFNNSNGDSFNKITGVHPAIESNTSISSSWADYDNDGDQDLFVANAASVGKENLFYTNNGDSSFDKVTNGDLVKDKRASMGATWADYDNDGDLDLFVANQANFTNDLYENDSDGSFTAIRTGDVVTEKSFSISGSFVDFDNDGDLDLFVTNWQNNKNFLYHNSGFPDYSFSKITNGDIVNNSENSMAAGWADYDNDGDLDLYIANRENNNNSFYRNDHSENNWIQIKLTGVQSNRSALGTKIRVKAEIGANPIWQMRELNAQYGYNSQNDSRVHFGIGQTNIIDSLIVEWPSGLIQNFEDITVNNFYELNEGSNLKLLITSIEAENSPLPNKFILKQNYPNPFNPSTTIEVDVPASFTSKSVQLKLEVYDLLGSKVATIFNGSKTPGLHRFIFNGRNLSSGQYIYKASIGDKIISKKMNLIK